MRAPIFFGTVLPDKIKLDNSDRFKEYRKSLVGKRIELILRIHEPKEGKSDRGYYYAEIVPAFAQHMGYPKEEYNEVHEVIKKMMDITSTKKFTDADWREYIAGIKRKAAPLEIPIRDKRHIDL